MRGRSHSRSYSPRHGCSPRRGYSPQRGYSPRRNHSPRRDSHSPSHRSCTPPRRRYTSPRRSYSPRRSASPRRNDRRDESTSLLVRNVSRDIRPEDLRIPFEHFGPVKDVYLPKDYYTGEPRGFGFVQFMEPEHAVDAQYHMDKKVVGGREITVVFAEESRKKPQEMRKKERSRSSFRGFFGPMGRRRSPYGYGPWSRSRSRSRYSPSPPPRRVRYSRSSSLLHSRSRSRSPRAYRYSRSNSRSVSPAPRRHRREVSRSPTDSSSPPRRVYSSDGRNRRERSLDGSLQESSEQ
ncbi:hypothetical protein CBR_g49492 [Chara braunii]|uniref:RRM domain-containing protein n=1 Tax=Chara braunii TaxID=69332 RepID=A0A388K514_CHABU|nr:hypothetical protein CBR_g49492 [Chara braunii]|eukprot:GBG65131.1 hypothetical protein CBR_g49492 [Chara braunii]